MMKSGMTAYALRIGRRVSIAALSLLLSGLGALAQDAAEPNPGDPDFVWSQRSYVRTFIEKYAINEQQGKGVGGGYGQIVSIPGNYMSRTITKMHVYFDKDRIYGIQYEYDETDGEKGVLADLIGGNGGQHAEIELTSELPLFSVMAYYGDDVVDEDDDDAYDYNTPVMTGLTVRHYKINPMITRVEPGLTHEDLLETETFGNLKPKNPKSPPEGVGFDVYLGQWIKGFTACTAPMDRNGRIFSMGVIVKGLNGDGNDVTQDQVCYLQSDGDWWDQPLGAPRIKKTDPYGREVEDDYFDVTDYASGNYTKGEWVTDKDKFAWHGPLLMHADFGDKAEISFENMPEIQFELPLIVKKEDRRDPDKYAFEYGSKDGMWIGAEVESHRPTNTVDEEWEKLIALTFDHNQKNGRQYIGRWDEARLEDQKVAKRYGKRPEVEQSDQSKSGLFEVSNVVNGRGYMQTGWDWLTIDPGLSADSQPSDGQKGHIFDESGNFQYHMNTNENLAVPDGLRMQGQWSGQGSKEARTLVSEASALDAVGDSLGVTVPVKGVPVGVTMSRETENSVQSTDRSMKSMAQSTYSAFDLILDKPNAHLGALFTVDMKRLLTAKGAEADRIADDMVRKYGSHYTNAIRFGGYARAISDMSASEYAQKAIESYSVGVTVGDPAQAGITANHNERIERGTRDYQEFEKGEFWTKGGGGGFSADGWSANDHFVPIKFDLRPIYELVEPIIIAKVEYSTGIDEVTTGRMMAARKALEAAYDRHFDGIAGPDTKTKKPAIYQVSIKKLWCSDGGDDDDEIQIYGNISFRFESGEVPTKSKVLINGDNIVMQCGSDVTGVTLPVDKRRFFVYADVDHLGSHMVDNPFYGQPWAANQPAKYEQNYIRADFCTDFYEWDATALDYDETLDQCSSQYTGKVSTEIGKQVDTLLTVAPPRSNEYAPTINMVVVWTRLE